MNVKLLAILLPILGIAVLSYAQLPETGHLLISIKQYDHNRYNQVTAMHTQAVSSLSDESFQISTATAKWTINKTIRPADGLAGAQDISLTFILESGYSNQTSVALAFQFSGWSVDNFVFAPASTYAGNRFESRKIDYSPRLMHPKDVGIDQPTIITDVPRLNIQDGPSRMQLTSGSSAYPCMGYHAPIAGQGFLLTTDQGNKLGDYGMDIEESRDRTQAWFAITSPHVRELHQYNIANNQYPSTDRGHDFRAGDTVRVSCRTYSFPAKSITEYYSQYFQLHQEMVKKLMFTKQLPFSAAYRLIEQKYNSMNWNPAGFFAMDAIHNNRNWKPGWVSGMPAAYALWLGGKDSTREKVIRQNNWAFPNALASSGFFYERGIDGNTWIGGDPTKFHTHNWHLIRGSADALYYTLQLLKAQSGIVPKEIMQEWETGARVVANSFVGLWKQYQQFGQFVDSRTGAMLVGGSASAAIAPAALVLAADYFRDSSYLVVARQAAAYFHQQFIVKGYTTGGPGDALQNPDSESCYGLLESFVSLYEADNNPVWLTFAEETANLFATWVMPYHYRFPTQTAMGKINAETGGTVWANTQNRHGGPGICTSSGMALYKLYRATNNPAYLELLRVIAQTIPQYVSRPDRLIDKIPVGCIDERISTSDWFEGTGEITGLSTWSEISMMLTARELPGIYIRKDQGKLVVLDHVNASLKKKKGKWTLTIQNPTQYAASVRVVVEDGPPSQLVKKEPALIILQVASNGTRQIIL